MTSAIKTSGSSFEEKVVILQITVYIRQYPSQIFYLITTNHLSMLG